MDGPTRSWAAMTTAARIAASGDESRTARRASPTPMRGQGRWPGNRAGQSALRLRRHRRRWRPGSLRGHAAGADSLVPNIGSREKPDFATGTIVAFGGKYLIGDAHTGVKVADFDGDDLLDIVAGRFWERTDLNDIEASRATSAAFARNVGTPRRAALRANADATARLHRAIPDLRRDPPELRARRRLGRRWQDRSVGGRHRRVHLVLPQRVGHIDFRVFAPARNCRPAASH